MSGDAIQCGEDDRGSEGARTGTRWAGRLSVAFLLVLLLVYALFLARHYAPAISHPDANGYWAQGTLIARTGRASFRPQSPVQYIGAHWLLTDSGAYVSRYPPGLAVGVAVISRLFGPEASVLLNPVLAVLTLVGVFLLTRSLVGPVWDAVAVLAVAVIPAFNEHALTSISHMPVAALLVWGLYLLVCWSKHGRLLHAFCAGLLLGCIPTVRYPEAVYALGIAVFLLTHWRARPRIWVHWLAAATGALLPIVPLLIRNQLTFGAFYRTAYELTNEQTGFGTDYFEEHAIPYVQGLLGNGVGTILPLALLGIVLMIGMRRRTLTEEAGEPRAKVARPFGMLAALLVFPTVLLYMAYYWGGMRAGSASMRFLVPLFPLLTVTAVWALWVLTRHVGRAPRITAVCVVLLLHVLWGLPASLQQCRRIAYDHEVLARATAALREHVPSGSVVMAYETGILQHLDFIREWKLADPSLVRPARLLPLPGDDDTPRPMQSGKRQAQAAPYEGLSGLGRERAVAMDIQAWANGAGVFFVGTEAELSNATGAYFNSENFQVIARVALPDPPDQPGPFGLLRGGGRMAGQGGQGPGPGAMAGRGGPAGMRGMGGMRRMGGMLGMGFLRGEKELVIARWTPTERRFSSPGRPFRGRLAPF
jgi:hypothetical protein